MELTASSITPRSEAHAHPWLLRPSQAKRVLERSGRGSRIAQVQRMHWYTRASLVLTDAFAVLFTAAAALATARPLEVAFTPEALLKLSGVLAVSLALSGSYRRVAVHPAIEARRTALVLASVFGGGMAGLYALSGDAGVNGLLVLFGGAALLLAPLARLAGRILWGRFSWWGEPVAVLSTDGAGATIVDALCRWPEVGLRPVALLDEAALRDEKRPFLQGRLDEAAAFSRRYGIRHGVLAMPGHSRQRQANELRRCSKFFNYIYVIEGEPGFGTVCAAASRSEGLQGFAVRSAARARAYRFVKRLVDVVVSGAGLILFSPLLLVIAGSVAMSTPGPLLFRQQRMGRHGALFNVFKFRTMHAEAEARLAAVLDADPHLRAEYDAYHKLTNDPRVTGVGRFLRRYSLDELPQLWNVLRGDMSLIGPRAYVPAEIRDMVGLERVVLQARPGITGLWQVSGRNALPFTSRVHLDVHYVQASSLWLDLYLFVRTIPVVLTGEGAA